MLLIASDTATEAVTVARHDGGQIVAEESAIDARREALYRARYSAFGGRVTGPGRRKRVTP